MSLNLVSPGVKVREVDLTVGRADAANDQVGAIAGPFEMGPVNVPILIETEQDLLKTFGKPLSTDAQYDYWLSASSYLSYGGILRVVRTDGPALNNANDAGSSSVQVNSYEDYVNNHSTSTAWKFASRNPGKWANNLKVCTIDGAADQILNLTSTTGLAVGMGVTQSIEGRVSVGAGTTSAYTGVIRGVITEVSADKYVTIKVTDTVAADNSTYAAAEYEQGGALSFYAPSTSTTTPTVGIATTAGTIDTAFDITISGIVTTGVQVNDVVTVTGGNSTVATGTKVLNVGASVITVDQAITGISTAGDGAVFTFSRDGAPVTVNTNTIIARTAAGLTTTTINSGTVTDWYDMQTLGLTNSTVYWKSLAPKPGTSQYASERSAKNDEIHVVVVDDTGSVTGTAGNIIEKHTNLSKAKDATVSPTEAIYYKDLVSNNSENVFVGGSPTGVVGGTSGGTGTTFTATGVGNWGSDAQGVTFAVEGSKTYTLTAGQNYTASGGFAATLANIVSSYDLFTNVAEYPINFLINGPSGGDTIFESQAKANKLIAIADVRKDCIACISPHRAGVVNVSNSDTQTDNILNFFNGVTSSSYAVFDSGYKYMFDRFTNSFRYVPCNADVAGLMARTSLNQFPWFSPAGSSRGAINLAVKLAYNPTPAQRDLIYPKRVNPIVAQSGAGIILFGDRTGLAKASAFDRINVRRLFLTIEDSIERAAKDQLFEFNDVITRSNFVNIVEPYLRDVKAKRGITDFVVICDETNNTPDIIDSNQFKADIFVKPARSINFIGLSFVATRTGVSFEEVVGNV